MSKQVDERILKMEFDNKQFESNVKTSMSTLDRLKNSLNMSGASKGLENVSAAAKNVDMSGLGNAVDAVSVKFSALQIMGMTALSNITNSAIAAGKKIYGATVGQIIEGGNQRALNIEQAKFQLEGLGVAWDSIKDDINYGVKDTAYGLDAAAKVASQLVASNIEVGDSMKTSLRAVSGVAAMTNSSYEEIGHIFTTVAGNGKLMTIQLRELSNRGLNAAATLADYLGKSEAEVRDMVTKGKIDFETFAAAMDSAFGEHAKDANKTFTGAMSNVKAALSRIGADFATPYFDNLRNVFNALIPVIDGIHNALKPLIEDVTNAMKVVGDFIVGKLSNFDVDSIAPAFEAVENVFKGLLSVLKPIKDAFREVFLPATAEQIKSFTEKLRDLTAKFKISEETAEKLRNVFTAVFTVIKTVINGIKGFISIITGILSKATPVSQIILDFANSIGGAVGKITESFSPSEAISALISKVFSGISYVLSNAVPIITTVASKIGDVFKKLVSGIKDALGGGSGDKLNNLLNTGLVIVLLTKLKGFVDSLKKSTNPLSQINSSITGILDSVKNSLSEWQKSLKADSLLKIAGAIAILTASLVVLSGIDSDKLNKALVAIAALFGELMGAMAIFNKITANSKSSLKTSGILIAMSVSVLILAKALKTLSDLSWGQIAVGLTGLLGIMSILAGFQAVMTKINPKKMTSSAIGLIAIGVAMEIFADVCKKMGRLQWNELAGAGAAIAGILTIFAGFQELMKLINPKKMFSSATALVIIGAAMEIFADVCAKLGQLQWNELAKSGAAIAGVLTIFAGFQELMTLIKPEKMLKSATSLVVIGAAMEIFADVCSKFKELEWPDLGKVGVAIGGILALASGFMLLSGLANNMLRSSVALVVIGAAMEIFADVCGKFKELEWQELGKAGAAIAGILAFAAGFALLAGLSNKMLASSVALVIIGAAMEIFADVCNKFAVLKWRELGKAGAAIGGILALCAGFALLSGLSSNILISSVSLLVMAAALKILTPVITELGGMTWSNIAKGLVAIAGAFLVIGAAGLFIGPLAPEILMLSAAIALLGVGCLAAGAGMAAFAAGFAALAAAGASGAQSFVEALTVTVEGALALIPTICEAIVQSAPAIGEALKALVLTAIDVLVECIPQMAEGVLKLIVAVLEAVKTYVPQIVTLVFDIFKSIVESAMEALNAINPEEFLKGMAALTGLMLALNAMAVLAAGAMIGVLAMGAVIAELAVVIAAIGALAQIPGLEWLISEGGDFLQTIGTAIGQFVGGIVGGVAKGVTSTLPEVATNLSNFMLNLSPFIEGAKAIDESVLSNVESLVQIVLTLTGAGLIEAITSWLTGGSLISKFGEQLVIFGESIKAYSLAVAGIDISGVEASVTAGRALAELAKILPNSGGVLGFFAGNNDIDKFGEKIVPFGAAIKAYSLAVMGLNVSGIEASVVAGRALAELAESLPNSGGTAGFFAGNNDFNTFGANLEMFGYSIVNFSNTVAGVNIVGISQQLKTFASSLKALGQSGIDGFVKSFSDGSSKVRAAANQMMATFINAVNAKKTSVQNSFTTLLASIITVIRGKYQYFYSAGAYLVQGFAAGISANTYMATAKAKAMADAATQTAQAALKVNSPSKVFMSIGRSVGEGFAKGIGDKAQTSNVVNTTIGLANHVISSAKDTLEINSPSRAFMAIGRYIGEGLAIGIRDSAKEAVNASSDMANKIASVTKKSFDNIEKWVEEAKYFDELSLNDELVLWNRVIDKYKEGSEERLKAEKNAYSVYKELGKEGFEASKQWISDRKYYNELSLEAELAAWERMQSRYKWDSEERKEIDKEIYRVKNELTQQGYEDSKAWMDKEKTYNRLTVEDELEAWKRIRDKFWFDTDIVEEANKQIYQLTHEIIDGSIDGLERHITSLKNLLAGLEAGSWEYINTLKEIEYSEKLLNEAKYENSENWVSKQKKLDKLGLADKLAANRRMQKEEGRTAEDLEKLRLEEYEILKEINEKYEQMQKDAEDTVKEHTKQMEALEKEKSDKIKEINEKLADDIDRLNDEYNSKLESRTDALYKAYGLFDEVSSKDKVKGSTLMKNLQDQVAEFEDWTDILGSLAGRGLSDELIEELQEMGPSAIEQLKGLNSLTDSQLAQWSNLWSDKHKEATDKATAELKDFRKETDNQIEQLKIDAQADIDGWVGYYAEKMDELETETDKTLAKLQEDFRKELYVVQEDWDENFKNMGETANMLLREAGWDETGEYIIDGLTQGIKRGTIDFLEAIKATMNAGEDTANETAEINSPSKKFTQIGMYLIQGLIVGVNSQKDKFLDTTEDVGTDAIDMMRGIVGRVLAFANSDIDIQPTIRPVIDLSDVNSSISQMNGMLVANRSMSLGMSIGSTIQNGNKSLMEEMTAKMEASNAKLNDKFSEAMDGIRSDIANLVDEVSRLQVVLDGDTLVGAITPKMDRSLGVRATIKRRGSI